MTGGQQISGGETVQRIENAQPEFVTIDDPRKKEQLQPAIDYLHANYDQQIKLSDVADSAGLSISRLAHLFKEQTGITIIDYLTKIRVNHAQRLLASTRESCSKICFSVGFNNQSYFTRTFKKIVGMTPQKFRSSRRRIQEITSTADRKTAALDVIDRG